MYVWCFSKTFELYDFLQILQANFVLSFIVFLYLNSFNFNLFPSILLPEDFSYNFVLLSSDCFFTFCFLSVFAVKFSGSFVLNCFLVLSLRIVSLGSIDFLVEFCIWFWICGIFFNFKSNTIGSLLPVGLGIFGSGLFAFLETTQYCLDLDCKVFCSLQVFGSIDETAVILSSLWDILLVEVCDGGAFVGLEVGYVLLVSEI